MKKRVIPKVSVQEIPYFEGNISHFDKEKYGMLLWDGTVNYYRVMFAKGQGGSRKEETWNREEYKHTCCQSKVPWRHKTQCPRLTL